jgi:ribosomal protein S18 acetylase RimI-like enzyme
VSHDDDAAEPFRIRSATAADLPAIGQLAGRLVRQHHAADAARFMLPDDVEEGYVWWFGRELENPDAVILAAVVAGTIGGYCYGRMEGRDWNALRDRCGALHDIFVAEGQRRRGIARALVDEMVRRLAALGAPQVVLATAWGNSGAQALFRSLGFRPTMIEMTRSTE